jgi:hypothetical protein
VTTLNATLATVATGVLVVAMTGSGPAAGQVFSSTTRPHGPSTTRTTRPTSSTTIRHVTTVPVTTAPPTSPPTVPPPTFRVPAFTLPPTTASTTTTTSTTIAAIGGHLPVPPSTVPFRTKAQSSHVSPVFAALSGGGFFVALVMMVTRFIMTRPKRNV